MPSDTRTDEARAGGAPDGSTLGTTRALDAPAGRAAFVRQFAVEVIDGPSKGLARSSTGERMVIGSSSGAELSLLDPTVSRFHCELSLADGRAVVRDLGSRNGTFVDGVGVVQAYLRTGSVLSLGESRLRFEVGDAVVPLPISGKARFGVMVGRSVAMRQAFAVLERAAASDATVLLEGETGTGKEVAAESIHRESARADGPFVVVDCGALPTELLESELFGHEKGAFTGAVSAREGAFEAAAGGTIFLDEIGELGAALQPKLLRALEKREVKRLGSNQYTKVDVRVVTATNRNLREEVNAQRFRSDLYYRVAVLEVRLPALRERTEDLPALVENILEALGMRERPEAEMLRRAECLAHLTRHAWPGNVRELRNYVERTLAMNEQLPLPSGRVVDGGPVVDTSRPLRVARDEWVRVLERRYLAEVLARHDGNVTAAARAAEMDRIHFYRLLWRHGLRERK